MSTYLILATRNRVTHAPVVDARSNIVVSLTTHGMRLRRAYITIESIGAGCHKPGRLILYVDQNDVASLRGIATLVRLMRRGLEVREAEASLRSHKKYIHFVESEDWHALDLVIADDDIMYPRRWLELLVDARGDVGDNCVVSHWTKEMGMTDSGTLLPYIEWNDTWGTEPSRGQYFMGGSGTLLPRSVVAALHREGRGFVGTADSVDDVWLNWVARVAGAEVRQVRDRPLRILTVPGTQRVKLGVENLVLGNNDEQLARLFTAEDMRGIEETP